MAFVEKLIVTKDSINSPFALFSGSSIDDIIKEMKYQHMHPISMAELLMFKTSPMYKEWTPTFASALVKGKIYSGTMLSCNKRYGQKPSLTSLEYLDQEIKDIPINWVRTLGKPIYAPDISKNAISYDDPRVQEKLIEQILGPLLPIINYQIEEVCIDRNVPNQARFLDGDIKFEDHVKDYLSLQLFNTADCDAIGESRLFLLGVESFNPENLSNLNIISKPNLIENSETIHMIGVFRYESMMKEFYQKALIPNEAYDILKEFHGEWFDYLNR